MSSKYKEKHPGKIYDFEKYINSSTSSGDNNSSSGRPKFHRQKADSTNIDINPVQNSNTKYSFDDEGIVIDLKNDANN